MRVTCPRCPAEWTGTRPAHCPACHETFSTNGVADHAHRGPADQVNCSDPAASGLVRNKRGLWSYPPGDRKWLESLRLSPESASEDAA